MSDELPVKRRRIPNLRKLLEHADSDTAAAANELVIEARLIEILAPFPAEARRRILRAAMALSGVEL